MPFPSCSSPSWQCYSLICRPTPSSSFGKATSSEPHPLTHPLVAPTLGWVKADKRRISVGYALSLGSIKPENIIGLLSSASSQRGLQSFLGKLGRHHSCDCLTYQHRSPWVNDLLLGCFPALAGTITLPFQSYKCFPSYRWVHKSSTTLTILTKMQHWLKWVMF